MTNYYFLLKVLNLMSTNKTIKIGLVEALETSCYLKRGLYYPDGTIRSLLERNFIKKHDVDTFSISVKGLWHLHKYRQKNKRKR